MAHIAQKTKPLKTNAASSRLVTFEEFYEIAEENVIYNLLDGRVIREPPPITKHGLMVSWLMGMVGMYVELFKLGEILGATVAVKFSQYQASEPDLLFISKNRGHIVNDRYVDGPPDLCVEVISENSRKRDRGRKFVLYADHGVKEYWIVDPLLNSVEFFENIEGEWKGILPDEKGRLNSRVLPGFWLDPRWFRELRLPRRSDALKEIVGEDYLVRRIEGR